MPDTEAITQRGIAPWCVCEASSETKGGLLVTLGQVLMMKL